MYIARLCTRILLMRMYVQFVIPNVRTTVMSILNETFKLCKHFEAPKPNHVAFNKARNSKRGRPTTTRLLSLYRGSLGFVVNSEDTYSPFINIICLINCHGFVMKYSICGSSAMFFHFANDDYYFMSASFFFNIYIFCI